MTSAYTNYDVLTCKVCDKYLKDPVILPCQENICKEHVVLANESNNLITYNCQICHKKHQVDSEEGFSSNENVSNLIKLNDHLDENAKMANEAIDDLEQVLTDWKCLIQKPGKLIEDYFEATRERIFTRRTQWIERAHCISDEMLALVAVLENEAKTDLESLNNVLIQQLEDKLDEMERLSGEWKDELRDPNIERQRVVEMLNQTKLCLSESQKKCAEFKEKILNDNGCSFTPNTSFQFKNEYFGKLDIFKITKHQSFSSIDPLNSAILTASQSLDLIELCEFDSEKTFTLVYKASIHGFGAKDFHAKCDKIPKTLTIIKPNQSENIFGGYTEATWDTDEGGSTWNFKQDKNFFSVSSTNTTSR